MSTRYTKINQRMKKSFHPLSLVETPKNFKKLAFLAKFVVKTLPEEINEITSDEPWGVHDHLQLNKSDWDQLRCLHSL